QVRAHLVASVALRASGGAQHLDSAADPVRSRDDAEADARQLLEQLERRQLGIEGAQRGRDRDDPVSCLAGACFMARALHAARASCTAHTLYAARALRMARGSFTARSPCTARALWTTRASFMALFPRTAPVLCAAQVPC